MIKKTVYFFMTLFVVFGMLAFASPASASTTRRIVGGRIIASNAQAKTLLIKPVTGKAVLVKTNKNTVIYRKGKSVTFPKLRVGDKLNISFDVATKLAKDISADSSRYEIHGSIEAVDSVANSVTIASEEGGNSVTVKVSSTTIITRHGVAATFADLVIGDKVEAKYNSATMLASLIKLESEDGEFYGTIAAVNIAGNTVTVTPELGGADVVLKIALSTVIKRADKVVALGALQVGDRVEAKYDSLTMIASVIESESEGGEVHGTIAAVDTVASTVTITPELGGADVVLNINLSTVILRNDVPAALADLLAGDKVEAKYDSATMIASLIKTEMENGEIHGTIAAVDTVAKTVTITPELGGADVVVNVGLSTVVLRHDAPVTLADLLVGDKVEAKYDSATMVASLVDAE